MRFVTSWFLVVVMVYGTTGCVQEQVNYKVDLVPPGEFLLGPEDVLIVTVWKNQDLSREVVIRPDGMISMPLIGDVPAANMTANNLAKRISDRLTEYMASPIVSVQLKEVNSYFIYVMGEISKPGKYPLKSYANIMQGISLAGGFTPFAKKNKIKVLRVTTNGSAEKQQIEIPVEFDNILKGNATVGNFYLRSGDVIVVP
ncbi:MAG: polysaccharide biosynthesis/export family protein [Nitrospira sp.]|jgi:polysaccharide export outer membrane protein|nr:polysaccharide biosynthesis/export family protein [Nitrospira sp.]